MARDEDSPLQAGTLYVVSTPIGNLGDLSPRALSVLRGAEILAAEDTRVLRKLASAFEIGSGARLTALHEHNERDRAAWVVQQLQAGRTVGLFSDAGTPLVSDPGFPVVAAAVAAGCPVVAVPGASALLCALAVAGLPTDAFRFCGFLPRVAGKRRAAVEALAAESGTLVFYEAQQRVLDTLDALLEGLGDRPVAACCDLTKRGERVMRGPMSRVRATLAEAAPLQGEWVLVVGGKAPAAATEGLPPEVERLLAVLVGSALGAREIRDVVVATFEVPKGLVYKRVLELRPG